MTEIKKIVIDSRPDGDPPPIEQDLAAPVEGVKPRPPHEMYGSAQGLYADQGIDPVDLIRALRDEWD